MGEHAKIAPSALGRIFQCPGSVKLSEGIPGTSSKFADEGSLAHEVAALILPSEFPVSTMLDEIQMGLHTFTYGHPDSTMLGHVEGYVDAMRELIALDPDGYFEVEQKVHILPDIWGTVDFWAWLPAFGMVVCRDLKYGAGQYVDVRGNKQQKAYLLGVVKKLRELDLLDRPIEDVVFEMGVYQPRNRGNEGEAHRTQIVPYQELIEFEDSLVKLSDLVFQGTKFGDGKECRWCKAAIKCPLNTAAVAALEAGDSSSEPLSPHISNEQLAEWLNISKRYNRFMAAVKEEAGARAAMGEVIPGYEYSEDFGNRKWLDTKVTIATLRGLVADPAVLFEPGNLKSPAQMDKISAPVKSYVKTLTISPSLGYSLKRTT